MERRLLGGNLGGAVRVGDTVRRSAGPWTPAVAALLRHLEHVGFDRAPGFLGLDQQGREVLSFVEGETVGGARPWPAWLVAQGHADDSERAADELADFVP
jgi:hypothetical protein